MSYHVCHDDDRCVWCGRSGVVLGEWGRQIICGYCMAGRAPGVPRTCGRAGCDVDV